MMERNELKENTIHGTNSYPFAVYRWDGDTEYNVPLHWHKETEILYLKKGSFRLSINMHDFVLPAPALIFIGAEEIHSIDIAVGDIEHAIVFDLGMLSFENYDGIQYKVIGPLIEKTIHFPWLLTEKDLVWTEAAAIFEEVFDEAEKKELSAYLKVKAGLYRLIACLYENGYLKNVAELEEREAFRLDSMKQVLTYIRGHYTNRLTVEEIAAVAGMNPQYFCRFFKKNTGKTVTEYINDIRINQAALRLVETEDKIIDIAGGCGYDNIGYFIKRFEQSKGITPSEYRKRNKVKIV